MVQYLDQVNQLMAEKAALLDKLRRSEKELDVLKNEVQRFK